jgi:hypothetical protein
MGSFFKLKEESMVETNSNHDFWGNVCTSLTLLRTDIAYEVSPIVLSMTQFCFVLTQD